MLPLEAGFVGRPRPPPGTRPRMILNCEQGTSFSNWHLNRPAPRYHLWKPWPNRSNVLHKFVLLHLLGLLINIFFKKDILHVTARKVARLTFHQEDGEPVKLPLPSWIVVFWGQLTLHVKILWPVSSPPWLFCAANAFTCGTRKCITADYWTNAKMITCYCYPHEIITGCWTRHRITTTYCPRTKTITYYGFGRENISGAS